MKALTEAELRKLEPGRYVGFGRGILARKKQDGSVTIVLRKRMPGSSAKISPPKHRLGVWPDSSLNDIELRLAQTRQLIDKGIHPKEHQENQQKEKKSKEAEELRNAVTLEKLLEIYEQSREDYDRGNAPRTMKDRRNTICLVFQEWLDKPIQMITKDVVGDKFNEWSSQRPGKPKEQTKKAIRYLRSMMNHAINVKDYLEKNPCDAFKGVISSKAGINKQTLTGKESAAFLEWSARITDPNQRGNFLDKPYNFTKKNLSRDRLFMHQATILLLLTGLRRQEVLGLEWEDVHLTEAEWREEGASGPFFLLIPERSKQQQPFGIPITDVMKETFNSLKANQINRFVFPSSRPGKKKEAHLVEEGGAYEIMHRLMPGKLKLATNFTAQLLRKTFASTAYGLGYSTEQVEMYTAHRATLQSRNVAMDAYVRVTADNHRDAFQRINEHLVGVEQLPDEAYENFAYENEESLEEFSVVPGGDDSTKENLV